MTVRTPLKGRPTTVAAIASTDTPNWRVRGACRKEDPDLFFSTAVKDQEKAKAVCAGCPVTRQCAALGDTMQAPSGVWGGVERVDTKRSYGASQLTATQDLLLNRRAELDAAIREGLTPSEIALRLRTNVQTATSALLALRAGDADWHLMPPDGDAVRAYLAGERSDVAPQDRLAAVVQGARDGLPFTHFDRLYGLRGHATSEFVRRARLVFETAGMEFPDLGQRRPQRALKDDDVVAMRKLAVFGAASDGELAERYGVSPRMIRSVVTGASYADVGGPLRGPRLRASVSAEVRDGRPVAGQDSWGAAA